MTVKGSTACSTAKGDGTPYPACSIQRPPKQEESWGLFNKRGLPTVLSTAEAEVSGDGVLMTVRMTSERLEGPEPPSTTSASEHSDSTDKRKIRKKKHAAAKGMEGDAGHRTSAAGGGTQKKNQLSDLGPNWYQELSFAQMKFVDSLELALKMDSEEAPDVNHTKCVLAGLGIIPRPKTTLVRNAGHLAFWNPVLFLLYLYKGIRNEKENEAQKYSINERLILSALVHLVLPKTLLDLEQRMPPPAKRPAIRKKPPVGDSIYKSYIKYPSPYLEPLKTCMYMPGEEGPPRPKRQRAPVIEDTKEKMIKSVSFHGKHTESSGDTEDPASQDNEKEVEGPTVTADASVSRIGNQKMQPSFPKSVSTKLTRERKSRYFKRQQAISIPDSISTATVASTASAGNEKILCAGVTTSPSFGSGPATVFVEGVEAESDQDDECECPGPVDSKTALRENPEEKPLELKEAHRLPPPMSTVPTIHAAIKNYFKVDPSDVLKPVKGWKEGSPDPIYNIIVEKLLEILAKEGNPLGALPYASMLPQIQVWLLNRQGFKLTRQAIDQMEVQTCGKLIFCIDNQKNLKPPSTALTPKEASNLTWDKISWLRKKMRRMKANFYRELRQAQVNDARDYGMFIHFTGNKKFRDVYFSYLPSREEDVYPIHPPII